MIGLAKILQKYMVPFKKIQLMGISDPPIQTLGGLSPLETPISAASTYIVFSNEIERFVINRRLNYFFNSINVTKIVNLISVLI